MDCLICGLSYRNVIVEKKECVCSHRTTEREEERKRALMNRLKRIEGQVRGIQRMLEEDVYCADILAQVSAVNSALNGFNKELLSDHLHICVVRDIRAGNEEAVDELVMLLRKLMR